MLERLIEDLKLTPVWVELVAVYSSAAAAGVLCAFAWVGVWP
jgi:hypothetical protein